MALRLDKRVEAELRSIEGNQVQFFFYFGRMFTEQNMLSLGVLRLRGARAAVGVGILRGVHVSRMQRSPPLAGRAH